MQSNRLNVNEPDDQSLIDLALAGDNRAFEALVRRYQKPIYNLLFQMVRSHDAAADLTQESFLKVYKSLSSFRKGAKFKPWLYRIATNTCLNYLRDTKKETSLDGLLEEEPHQEPASSMNVEEEVELKISHQQLFVALEKLPVRHRTIFVLRYQHDLSYDDISGATSEPVSTIKSLLFRIREKLRQMLASEHSSEQNPLTKGGD